MNGKVYLSLILNTQQLHLSELQGYCRELYCEGHKYSPLHKVRGASGENWSRH